MWARVRGKTSKADSIVGVSYRPASPGEEVGEAFFKQVKEVSASQILALLGGFNLPDLFQQDSLTQDTTNQNFWRVSGVTSQYRY